MNDIKTKLRYFYQSIAIYRDADANVIKYVYSDIHTTKRRAENDIGRKIEKIGKNFEYSAILYTRLIGQQQLLESSVNEIDLIGEYIIIK